MKVLLKVEEIPLGYTVVKRTGSVPYVLRDRIVIGGGGRPQEIVAGPGTKFLCGDRGNITTVADHVEMLWEISMDDLTFWLEQQKEETP